MVNPFLSNQRNSNQFLILILKGSSRTSQI
jgi:hypothetical protein